MNGKSSFGFKVNYDKIKQMIIFCVSNVGRNYDNFIWIKRNRTNMVW